MRGARIAAIVLVAAIAGFLVARWLGSERDGVPTSHAALPRAPSSPAPQSASPPQVLRGEPSGTIVIDSASLPQDRPVVLQLGLGGLRPLESVPMRIVSVDGRRSLEARAVVDPERKDEVRFAIEPQFLEPGRYMVEVRVVTLMPLNVRRYAVEVR